jgi:hypothetical protein
MSARAPILSTSWRVGCRTVTMDVPPAEPGQPLHVCIEWAPNTPPALNRSEWREYERGRNAAIRELARRTGLRIAVVDL